MVPEAPEGAFRVVKDPHLEARISLGLNPASAPYYMCVLGRVV